MSFSLRFTADLTFALAARAIGARCGHPLILQLSTDNILDSASAPRSANGLERGRDSSQSPPAMLPQYHSPIIWITGSEPLEHPEVARFTNAIAASGQHLFLETSGASLKPRLHEFQPSSRFYFAIRFDGRISSDGLRNTREGSFRAGLEAIRMARLAGFYICAHLVLQTDTAGGELEELHGEICKLDVDGFVISPGALTPELAKQAGRLRRHLLDRRCALLSSLLDSDAGSAISRKSSERERPPLPKSHRDRFGEGAEAG
ncbi:MAG: hypothetical protein ACYDCG_09410 [Candidatus Acidiferrales bacterium]